jgi:YjbE family integral membrane protein
MGAVTDLAASLPGLSALLQVILIDVALSGDNAIIIGMAAAGLPDVQRKQAITIGIGGAVVLRIVFAVAAVYLLAIPGIVLVGGAMLAWVCVKMWREIRREAADEAAHVSHHPKKLWDAITQITVADASMSLDNVLAVAGAARDHIYIMAVGLILAIAMMAVAANAISGLLKRWFWLNYAGLALIAFVAVKMMVEGAHSIAPLIATLVNRT